MQSESLKEVISEVRSAFKLQEVAAAIPDRFIASLLQSTSLLFIRQATDKRQLWNSSNIFTTISCLRLKQVPLAECCGYTSPCDIGRSMYRLPKIAEGTKFGMLIQGVYSIDGLSRKFIESSAERYANSLSLGIRTKEIHYWIQDKYLYISDPNIEMVKISAYFEEDIPIVLQSYPNYCNNSAAKGCCPSSDESYSVQDQSLCCPPNPYDLVFKSPGYMKASIIDKVCEILRKTYMNTPNNTEKKSINEEV